MKITILQLDTFLARYFEQANRPKWLDSFFIGVTRLGDYGIVWFVLSGIYMLSPEEAYSFLGKILCGGILLTILLGEGIIKNITRRKRPFLEHADISPGLPPPASFSFPSGHSAISWCAVGTLFAAESLISPMILWGAILLAWLIAFSRMYLRVHYVSDVIAGIMLGILTSQLSLYLSHFFT